MRQHRYFVPMRLALTVLAMLFVAIASPKAATEIILASSGLEKPQLDPIITGHTVSKEFLKDWKAKKAKYDQCGLCGEAQPFPGDLTD